MPQQESVESKGISIKLQSKTFWYIIPIGLLLIPILVLAFTNQIPFSLDAVKEAFNNEFVLYLLVGLAAQLVDGTLGMAYGTTRG
jgi:hypothetical protein